MSGFITNLLSRNTGRMSAIRPRLASVFEPQRIAVAQPVDAPWQEPAESWEAPNLAARDNSDAAATDPVVRRDNFVASLEPQVEIPAPISTPRTTTSVPHVDILVSQTESRQKSLPAAYREELTAGLPSRAGDSEVIASTDSGSRATHHPDSERSPRYDKSTRPQNAIRPPALRDPIDASRSYANRSADTRVGAPFQQRNTLGTAPEQSPIAIHVDANAREPKPAISYGRSSLNQSVGESRFSLKPERNAVVIPKIESVPEPTVHVSIDRIEVRAIPPPTPVPRAERAAQPTMSLKEYMRRRAPRAISGESIS